MDGKVKIKFPVTLNLDYLEFLDFNIGRLPLQSIIQFSKKHEISLVPCILIQSIQLAENDSGSERDDRLCYVFSDSSSDESDRNLDGSGEVGRGNRVNSSFTDTLFERYGIKKKHEWLLL